MAERGRGTSQNVPNDLLAQLVEVLQGMNENLQNLNRSVASGPGSHTLFSQGPTEYRELDKSYRRNPSQFQGGFALNAAIEWVQGIECTNMKADEVATSKSIPPKNFGPQRNFVHGRGKGKMFHEERKPYFPPVDSCFHCKKTGHIKRYCPTTRQSMNAMGTGRPQSIGRVVTMRGADASEVDGLTHWSKLTVGGFQPDVFPMCSKCERKHAGTICPGSGNGCFHCKEKGHIKRFCLKLNRSVNVVKVGRPSTTGRVSTMSGTDTSGVDSLIQGKRMMTVRFNSGNGLIVSKSGYD
ncbi:hypothetical protein Lal_00022874 [Lupinus albus]|nr:hypothetical protein Lal_00022874 [Lupinus albus]